MKTAKELFNLTVYELRDGIAEVGDGAERFIVTASSLNDEFREELSDEEIRMAYDSWCAKASAGDRT